MSRILTCSLRGTKSNYSDNVFKKWITENKQWKSLISKKEKGQKISSCKGIHSIWIKKQPKITPEFTTPQILIVNRGTRRIII